MKKLLFTAMVLGVISPSFAQKDKEFVVFTSQEDKPGDLRFLALEIPIWHLTGSAVNTSLYNVKSTLSYVGKGNINGGVSYNWKVGDRIAPETYERTGYVYQDMIMSKYETSPAQSLDVWGTYFFKEETSNIKETIRLKKVGNTVYVTDVDAKQLSRTGFQLGYSQGFTWYNMNSMDVTLVDPNTNTDQVLNLQSASTIQTTKIIKAGLSFTKAVNVKVDVEKYGKRSAAYLSSNTFNVMFAVQNDYDDVLVGRANTTTNEVDFMEYQFSDQNKRLPIGFEYLHKEHAKGWISYEYGVGYYPGLLKKINIGVHFGVSVQIDMLKGK